MHPPFSLALSEVIHHYRRLGRSNIVYEEWSIRKLRTASSVHWTEERFAQFIYENFDIHMFISHPHQGSNGLGWNAELLYQQLRKYLYYRPGYPFEDGWFCPIWTQNKMAYLAAVPEIVNSSMMLNYQTWLQYSSLEKIEVLEKYDAIMF